MPQIHVPRKPKTLAEQWANEAQLSGGTLVDVFMLEEHPERACGDPKCGKYVEPLSIHIVDNGRPWHMDCWYSTYERQRDGSLQLKMF